jgi:hypothetical protein
MKRATKRVEDILSLISILQLLARRPFRLGLLILRTITGCRGLVRLRLMKRIKLDIIQAEQIFTLPKTIQKLSLRKPPFPPRLRRR